MRKKPFKSINVVPFIDIMLVLLVIVLTTASFVQTGMIPLELPQASATKQPDPETALKISITKEGLFYFDEEPVEEGALEERLLAYKRSQPIHLYCDQEAKYAHFVSLLDLLKRYRFENLGIVTVHE
jgi:biopolymer transport protein ExbD